MQAGDARMTAVSSAAPSPTLLRERALPATVPLTVAGAGLLALTAAAGEPFVALALALGGYLLSLGLPAALGASNLHRSGFVLALATLLASAAVLGIEDEPRLRLLPVAIAASLIVAFLMQLTRSDNRPQLARTIASDALGLAVIASGLSLAPVADLHAEQAVVGAAMAAIAVSALLDLLLAGPYAAWLLPGAALLGAVGAMLVGLAVAGGATLWAYAVLGAVAAATAQATRRVLTDAALHPTSAPASAADGASSAWLTREQASAARATVSKDSALTVAVAGLLAPGLAVFAIARLFLG